MHILSKEFFDRPVLQIAPELLGKVLVCSDRSERGLRGIITEVEAYDGPDDRACHASKGKTLRMVTMFGPAGYWYVYLCYGMHWMLNIVCEREGYPAAILIRGICTREGVQLKNTSHQPHPFLGADINGPGKVTKYFRINQRFNGQPATRHTGLWIEDHGIVVPKGHIQRTPRIGVDYAGAWAKKPYRFIYPMPALNRR